MNQIYNFLVAEKYIFLNKYILNFQNTKYINTLLIIFFSYNNYFFRIYNCNLHKKFMTPIQKLQILSFKFQKEIDNSHKNRSLHSDCTVWKWAWENFWIKFALFVELFLNLPKFFLKCKTLLSISISQPPKKTTFKVSLNCVTLLTSTLILAASNRQWFNKCTRFRSNCLFTL